MAGTHAVKADGGAAPLRRGAIEFRQSPRDAGAQRGERSDTAAVGGQLGDLTAGNQVADFVGFRLKMQRVGLHRNRLVAGADREYSVLLHSGGNVHDDARLLVLAETSGLNPQDIGSVVQACEIVNASAVGFAGTSLVCRHVGYGDCCIGNYCPSRVSDGSRQFCVFLRKYCCCACQ